MKLFYITEDSFFNIDKFLGMEHMNSYDGGYSQNYNSWIRFHLQDGYMDSPHRRWDDNNIATIQERLEKFIQNKEFIIDSKDWYFKETKDVVKQ